MVVIRLARGGSKKSPFYQIVATDSRNSRDGRFIEKLGFYNPVARGKATSIEVDIERYDYWISQGAQISDRVSKVLKAFKKGETQATELSSNDRRREQAEKAAEAARAAKEKEAKAAAEAAAKEAEETAKDADASADADAESTDVSE